jgi:hypothetical protein
MEYCKIKNIKIEIKQYHRFKIFSHSNSEIILINFKRVDIIIAVEMKILMILRIHLYLSFKPAKYFNKCRLIKKIKSINSKH